MSQKPKENRAHSLLAMRIVWVSIGLMSLLFSFYTFKLVQPETVRLAPGWVAFLTLPIFILVLFLPRLSKARLPWRVWQTLEPSMKTALVYILIYSHLQAITSVGIVIAMVYLDIRQLIPHLLLTMVGLFIFRPRISLVKKPE